MKYQERLDNLAKELVTEERFGRVIDAADVALGDTVEFDLPETARIYQFPQLNMDVGPEAA